MATPKKLPSGRWRVQVPSYKENGKWKYESFTADTKAQAAEIAASFAAKKERYSRNDLTVAEAVDLYICDREHVLSPATIRGYRIAEKRITAIGTIRLKRLTNHDLQVFINTLSSMYAPKYVKNVYGVLTAAAAYFQPETVYRVKLPKARETRLNAPTEADVTALLEATDGWFKVAICLAGFSSLRRGEVCALKHKDIDREKHLVHVHATMVKGPEGGWTYKDTAKTPESNRYASCPAFVLDMIEEGDPEDRIFNYTPSCVTKRFTALRDRLGLDIRFHDLRSFFASSLLTINVPDVYVAKQGGWRKDSPVLKRTYQRIMADKERIYEEKSEEYFQTLVR